MRTEVWRWDEQEGQGLGGARLPSGVREVPEGITGRGTS